MSAKQDNNCHDLGQMRSDRLLSILLLLQVHGRLSAGELAERLEVAERTIHRDVEALSAAGVPVYAERGRHGGIALLPGYRTDVSGLTAPEARALFVFAGRGTLADLGLEADLRSALRKLLSVLPEPHRPGAEQAAGRVVVDPRAWMQSRDELPHLAAVQEAVWRDRRLRVRYRRPGADEAAERLLDPYGLVAKAGTWYLVGAAGGEARLYRVSRIEAAEVTGEPADRPPDLDLEALWEELRGRVEDRGPGVRVLVRVRPERLQLVLRVVASHLVERAGEAPAGADGWPRLDLRYPAAGAAVASLLAFGADVEVLEPPGVRADLRDAARAIVALYMRDNST
jgi:predicted DNA-binding transcriptional regulator YafY